MIVDFFRILQEPFFIFDADDAINYGTIGRLSNIIGFGEKNLYDIRKNKKL
jgi:predicted metalloendopeptidase